MSRANPFGDLGDFAPTPAAKPVAADAIEAVAKDNGFPSRRPGAGQAPPPEPVSPAPPEPPRRGRRHVTGRNRQINIKATEETIAALYRIAEDRDLPLGAVLEQALAALENR